MFPNRYSVYLHDTPSRRLFNRSERAFSSGCIRIEDPLDLAEQLLAGSRRWTRDKIEQAIDSGETKTVLLPEPIPIMLLYWTAGVDEDGIMRFKTDIYERDPALLEALDRDPPSLIAGL